MAPEQIDAGDVTGAADQFSFAVTLWEALDGLRPFEVSPRVGDRADRGAARRGDRARGRKLRGRACLAASTGSCGARSPRIPRTGGRR